MGRWRKVEVATWEDERVVELSQPPPNGQTLWFYLLCGVRTTCFPGLVVAREEVIASDLRWPLEGFREAFGEVFTKGLAKASWKAGLVVLPKALIDSSGEPRETARPASPNVIKSWAKSWDEVPECDLKYEYLRLLESFTKGLGVPFEKAFREGFRKALTKPSPNQEKEKEKKKEQEKEGTPLSPPAAGTPKTGTPKVTPSSEAIGAAKRLMARVVLNNPGSTQANAPEAKRESTVVRWADAMRLLHDVDGHSWPDIEALIDWCQSDQFWKSNILSGDKLREKWDQLWAKRAATAGGSDGYDVRYGRARMPSPEEYEQEDDPFGERTPKPGAVTS
jgi:hypothetical protein